MNRLLVLFVLLPLIAFAQTVLTDSSTAVAPSLNFLEMVKGFLTPSGLASALALIGGFIGGLAFLTQRRKKIVALAAYYAFHITEDIGLEMDGDDKLDKAAEYLKQVDAYMVAKGWRPLKPGEVAAVALEGRALHGAEIAKAKVAEAAALAQVVAANSLANKSPPSP